MQQNLYQTAMHIGRVDAELLVPELCQVVKLLSRIFRILSQIILSVTPFVSSWWPRIVFCLAGSPHTCK